MSDLIDRIELMRQIAEFGREIPKDQVMEVIARVPTADRPKGEWIPVSEKLPKYRQSVLLSANNGTVFIGHRCKPDLVWQVTEEDGRKHWVYDPESYTNDIDSLPKAEDCSFDEDSTYGDNTLSVTSVNYDERFAGVIAWMPLPEPYKGGEDE